VAVVTNGASEELFNRPEVEQLQVFAALDHLLQPLEANGRREVQQRSREGRDRDVVPKRPVLGGEGAGFVKSK
jgi:hypothetical protein